MKALSMFANIGIAELFFKKIGIETVVANELNPKRAKFYNYVYKNVDMVVGDIKSETIFNKVIAKSIKYNVEMIIATPPCQGMSTVGKGRSWRDERNILIDYVIKAAIKLQPKYIFIENVPTFNRTIVNINGRDIHIEEHIIEELSKYYFISSKVFNAADLGVAQNRKRSVFLLSNLKKCKPEEFLDVKKVTKNKKQKTVRDVIGNLPSLEATVRKKSNEKKNIDFSISENLHRPPVHSERHIDIMRKTPTGMSAFQNCKEYQPRKKDGTLIKGFLTTYKRMEWDKPSPTVTMANGSISSQNNVHPGRKLPNNDYSDARVLTILELMKIMSIPEDWLIPNWAEETFIRSVIGEGIPPLMSFEILKQIRNKKI